MSRPTLPPVGWWRKSPYTANVGEYIPMQYHGTTIWATVTHPLVGQRNPVVVWEKGGRYFICPAEHYVQEQP